MNRTWLIAITGFALATLAACGPGDATVGSDGGSHDLAAGGGGDAGGSHDLAQTASHDLAGGGGGDLAGHTSTDLSGPHTVKKVFIIMMENADWKSWKGSSSAPFVNNTLLPESAHAENYFNPAGNHPSLPNYLWLEAGDNLGVTSDGEPDGAGLHQATTDHLVTQLETAGKTWKAYVENIDGTACPLSDSGLFATKHVPMLFFDDVTNSNSTTSTRCINHVRPYTELMTDLQNNTLADYNFITPNLCDDAHGSNVLALDFTCAPVVTDLIAKGDAFLSTAVPMITGASSFTGGGGVLFVAWDEGANSTSDGPIGFMAVGAGVKAGGYSSPVGFTHSSTLRSVEEIFSLPLLRGAQTSNDLSDLFSTFP